MSKAIVVTGNSNSGKTMFSYFLANALCKNDKRVMIVSTNNIYPDFHYLLPIEKEVKINKSLGRVLALAVIYKKDILSNMLTLRNPNIGVLCYSLNESKNSYPSISPSNLEVLFELLKDCVDYVIVDTQSTINDIDKYAMTVSDINYCITTADMKGAAFRQQIDEELFTHILYSNNKFNAFEDIKGTFKRRPKYEMPHYPILQSVYNGDYIDDTVCPKKYSRLLNKLILEDIINE